MHLEPATVIRQHMFGLVGVDEGLQGRGVVQHPVWSFDIPVTAKLSPCDYPSMELVADPTDQEPWTLNGPLGAYGIAFIGIKAVAADRIEGELSLLVSTTVGPNPFTQRQAVYFERP